jgi:hypothetical protein
MRLPMALGVRKPAQEHTRESQGQLSGSATQRSGGTGPEERRRWVAGPLQGRALPDPESSFRAVLLRRSRRLLGSGGRAADTGRSQNSPFLPIVAVLQHYPLKPSRGLYQSRRAADAELPSPKVLQRSLVWRRRARGGVAQIKRVLVKLASEPGGKGPVYESRELGAPPPPGGRGSGAGWLVGPAVGRMRL